MSSRWATRVFALQALAAVLFLLRWPLIPDVLPNFDSANFAYALHDFNPAEHKPQPPGYPFFVGLSRVIHMYVADVPTVLVLSGLVGALIALIAAAALADSIAGHRAALFSTLLLLVHPALWSDGILNPVRAFLAAGSAVLGLACWKAWDRGSNSRWLVAAFAAAGIIFGFRPALVVLLTPLLLVAALRRRTSWQTWVISCGAMALFTASALLVSASASGGLSAFIALLRSYLQEQSESSSLLYGASPLPALKMAGRALIWAFVPAVGWLWLVARPASRRFPHAGFFLLWIMPPLLFATLIHSAEPGHILPLVVPACVLGGLLLNSAPRPVLSAGVAVSTSAALFLWPPIPVMRPSSIAAIQVEEARVAHALSLVRQGSNPGPVTIVTAPAAAVPWRVLTHYFPQHSLVALYSDPGSGRAPGYWQVRGGTLEKQGAAEVAIDGCSVVWFLSANSTSLAAKAVNARQAAPALLSGPVDAQIGEYRFHSPSTCSPISAVR